MNLVFRMCAAILIGGLLPTGAALADSQRPSARSSWDEPVTHEDPEARAAELKVRECEDLRLRKQALERIRNGESTEIRSAEELATLPDSIAEVEIRIETLCP